MDQFANQEEVSCHIFSEMCQSIIRKYGIHVKLYFPKLSVILDYCCRPAANRPSLGLGLVDNYLSFT